MSRDDCQRRRRACGGPGRPHLRSGCRRYNAIGCLTEAPFLVRPFSELLAARIYQLQGIIRMDRCPSVSVSESSKFCCASDFLRRCGCSSLSSNGRLFRLMTDPAQCLPGHTVSLIKASASYTFCNKGSLHDEPRISS